MRAAAAGALALALFASAGPATAQTLNLASGDQDTPIVVEADNGIEWQQDNEVLIARGNAHATRGGVTVYADVLRAYYDKAITGGASRLKRLDATGGKVRIVSASESLEGDAAVYDLDRAILVVTGKKVTYLSGQDVITANQQMEYYERDQKSVARGDAVAVHDGKTLAARQIEAYFHKVGNKNEVREVRAFEDVTIVTETDTVRASRAIYNVATGLATMVGGVKITRGQNQLDGDQAEINMNSGVSRLLTAPGAPSGGRVRGLIMPQNQPAQSPAKKGVTKGQTK
jgi:lipopolysaccharide export system protein LptA